MAKKKLFILLFLFLGIQTSAYSQKKSWFVFQPNAQGKNIQFTENNISVSSKNYPKPIHPFTKVPSAPPVPGVKNIENKTEISPNPASKSVTIKNLSEDCNKMTLLNNLGQALIEVELSDYQEERNLDISKYTNGIYYI